MLQTQDFYSEIKVLTQILLRISEEKIGGWGLWCGEGKFVADGKGGQRRFHKEALADLKIYECGVHLMYFPTSLFFASVFSVSVLHTVINFQICRGHNRELCFFTAELRLFNIISLFLYMR